ncbi:PREDICTED: uncharacterized protein LOC108571716 [Habropoda laboriosa]|nr:PREDICTED: uncharacterized protein LOC108571716 [Habropoda laboriosa]
MELPIPTCQEILVTRDRFRIQDCNLAEVVSCVQYNRTPLWFEECTEPCVDVRQFLLDEFQRNGEDLYDEELYHFDRDANGRSGISNVTLCCGNPEELLRQALAKKLLGRMYMIDRHTVNYTALLLAFCKDQDPREGFAKALALALGNRVCTNVEEGEKYAKELFEEKRLSEEAAEVVRFILDELIDQLDEEIGEGLSTTERRGTEDESEEQLNGEVSKSSLSERSVPDVIIYWLSLDVCLTVLAAALPWHVVQPEVIGTYESLCDSLTRVFKELRDEELNDEKDVVLVHRLLNHDFMKRLLISVNKFTAKKTGDMVDEMLRSRENAKSA